MSTDLSDRLPVAMVRSLRQCRRAPLYPLAVLCYILLAWIVVTPGEGELPKPGTVTWWLMAGVCGIVPAMIGMQIAGDNNENNFMRLVPIGSRRLVWGIWLSGLVQCVFFVLIFVPILLWAVDSVNAWKLAGVAVLLGGFFTSLWMMAFSLRGIVGKAAAVLVGICALNIGDAICLPLGTGSLFVWEVEAPVVLSAQLLMGTALFLVFMTHVRRVYASVTENLVALPRVIAVIGVAGLICLGVYAAPNESIWQMAMLLPEVVFILETALPMPEAWKVRSACPVLPRLLTVPGMWPAGWTLLLCTLPGLWVAYTHPWMIRDGQLFYIVKLVAEPVVAVLLAVAFMDLFCARSGTKRASTFVFILIVLFVLKDRLIDLLSLIRGDSVDGGSSYVILFSVSFVFYFIVTFRNKK
ncbi:MAG: hypothetical protein MR894_01545 [Akkermansia muciniphila]|nr:hypothetical protein [Akkermansia muciniphila]